MSRVSPEERVVIARLRRPWGLRGEVLADLYTDWPETRLAVGAVVTAVADDGTETELVVTGRRTIGAGELIRFEGILGIDDAKPVAGSMLTVPMGAGLPEMGPDEMHHAELVGLDVVDRQGVRLGVVLRVEEHAAGDYVVVGPGPGSSPADVLVPLARGLCVGIDRDAGQLVVDPPAGLFDPRQAAVVAPTTRGAK